MSEARRPTLRDLFAMSREELGVADDEPVGVFLIDVKSPERAEEIAATIPEAEFVAVEVRPASVFD